MISLSWSNPILYTSVDHVSYADELYEYILCNIPLSQTTVPEEVLLSEFYCHEQLFDRLKRLMISNINRMIEEGYGVERFDFHVKIFIIKNGRFTHTPFHNHRGAFISGVFYVRVDDKSGDLILHDPRFNAVRSTPLQLSEHFAPVRITPKSGDIILFPSSLYHETDICFSDEARVLIPFDVYIGKGQ